MNRVVRLGDLLVRQGVLGIVLLLPCLLSGQQQKAQNQSVPDAPTPQQPDNLGNLTHGCDARPGIAGNPARHGNKYHPGATCHRQPDIRRRPGATATAHHCPKPGQAIRTSRPSAPRVDYVTVPVTVLDKKHQQVAGLTWRDFRDLREQPAPTYRYFQCRCCGPLRRPGDRPEPAPGHHEEGER